MEKSIGSRLKQYREDACLTVEEVCQKLNTMGYKLSPKTLYGYENDVSSPKISVFVTLCNLYGISDISGCFGYGSEEKHPELRLSPSERALILLHRELDQESRSRLSGYLQCLVDEQRNRTSAKPKEA